MIRTHEGKIPLVTGDLLADGKGISVILGKLCPWVTQTENWQMKVHQNLFLSLKGPTINVWENTEQQGRCVKAACPAQYPEPHQPAAQAFPKPGVFETRLVGFFD